ncbi:MAG TPA: TetR/AcrR family transcriptional regulator [Candidatus Binataceae bacterium]|nr:TetR/AcrR family transcriptional regulator [Candidatus Binataceae bacterium]
MSRSSLQEERSAQTRRRLLDAAVACLSERGYTRTTTTEIAERAGVSRGAQVHHFRHKEELVLGALDHICERRLAELRYAFEELPMGAMEFRLETLLDLIWVAFRGPSFYAWLELLVASRTDPILRGAVRETNRRLSSGIRHAFAKFLDDGFTPPERAEKVARVVEIAFGKLESMALERALLESHEPDPPDLLRSLEELKQTAREILGSRDESRLGSRGAI